MCCGVGHGATDDCQTRLFLDLFKCLSDHLAPLLNNSQQVACLSKHPDFYRQETKAQGIISMSRCAASVRTGSGI